MKLAERESLKSLFIALAVSTAPLSIWSCSTSHDAISSSQIVVEKLLADAEREKVVQMASGQWARRWLADDYVVTLADGAVNRQAKKDILDNLQSGRWKIEAIGIDNINVRIFGDAAVVTATQREKSQFDGKDSGGTYQYTHTWAKRNGQWQIVSGHVSRLR